MLLLNEKRTDIKAHVYVECLHEFHFVCLWPQKMKENICASKVAFMVYCFWYNCGALAGVKFHSSYTSL